MRFQAYSRLDSSPNIIVDGSAGPGTILTLSHWPKSGTPARWKRDTSAESVFAYLDSPDGHVLADVCSNNHFDEDGLTGLFALIDPVTAYKYHSLLMDVSHAGDFGTYKLRDAARIAFTISAYADRDTSPLPRELFALPYAQFSDELYDHLLKLLPELLTDVEHFAPFWQQEDQKLVASEELVDRGEITIEERPEIDMAVVHLPENLASSRVHRFTQSRLDECHPMALHNRTERSRLLIIQRQGQGQRIEFRYRYESWVQFVSRRPLPRVDLNPLVAELNQQETSGGHWVFDGVERITPRFYLAGDATSSISVQTIVKRLEDHLTVSPPAWNPYDEVS